MRPLSQLITELITVQETGLAWRYRWMLEQVARLTGITIYHTLPVVEQLARIMRWTDLREAAALRWRALHEKTYVPHSLIDDLIAQERQSIRLIKAAPADPLLGTIKDAVMYVHPFAAEPALSQVARVNPWLQHHQARVNPVIEARAGWMSQVESTYYTEHAKRVAGIVKGDVEGTIPIYRLNRFHRDAVGEVQHVSQQIEYGNADVSDAFPFSRYSSRNDARCRPTHKAMHGFVAWRGWKGWTVCATRNGWNCRCSTYGVTRNEAIREGLMAKDGRILQMVKWPSDEAKSNYESKAFPDEGWRGPKVWTFPSEAKVEAAVA